MEQTLTMAPHDALRLKRRESQSTYTPRVDIHESEDGLTIYADLPGVDPDDVELRFENGELTLYARVKPRVADRVLAQEYGTGDFSRVFRLTHDIDKNNINASLNNGVMVLRLPKSQRLRPRKIDVQQA
jgi:HSP20 family protein